MAPKRISVESASSKAHAFNGQFDQILKRAVMGMRLIGIPLDPSGITSPVLRYWSIAFGLTAFISNVTFNALDLSSEINRLNVKTMTTIEANLLLSGLNFSFMLISCHAALLVCTAPGWKRVITTLGRIERLNLFQHEDFLRFRRAIKTGAISFLILVMFIGGISITLAVFPATFEDQPNQFGFIVYLLAGTCFFISLSWTVSSMLQVLRQQDHPIDLERWQRCYSLIVDLVDNLNDCFGLFVLVAVVFCFIWSVNAAFFVFVSLRENETKTSVLVVVLYQTTTVPIFLGFLYVPQRIKRQAAQLAGRLRSFHYRNDENLYRLARELELQILLSPPQMSVLGIVNIDFSILPTFLGTSITYVIILVQFKSSEELSDYSGKSLEL